MRDVILLITCSLDGFIAAEDGSVDWLIDEDEYDFDAFLAGVDTLLMGYTTYRQMLDFGEWPYNGKECYVFTNEHLDSVDDRVTFSNDPVGITENLMHGTGEAIWVVGGASIVSQLLNKGLINELRIAIQPIILGKGIPLFRDINKSISLKLRLSQEFNSGLIELVYVVSKK